MMNCTKYIYASGIFFSKQVDLHTPIHYLYAVFLMTREIIIEVIARLNQLTYQPFNPVILSLSKDQPFNLTPQLLQ